jgi:Uma2 family endonuclease
MVARRTATIEDFYRVPEDGKADLVDGEIVEMAAAGAWPHYAALEITVSLRAYAQRAGFGRAVGDNAGFVVSLPRRKSFSPDAAFHTGKSGRMRFYEGAPIFAVEVRSEGEYGPAAVRAMAARRADYFAAGTLVVWDVDLLSPEVVRVYRRDNPFQPTIYRRGEVAEAEPAVPCWTMPVDDLFEPE